YVGEPVEAYQVFHRIDYAPPSYLEIVQPRNLIGPGINEVRGVVHDESFVPTITLQVQTPSGPTDTIVCPDTTPDDEFWSCNWDVGTAAANDNVFKLRHKATDRLGHVSQWTDWLTLTVDTQPATVTLYLQAEAALGDGLLSADEATLSGQLADNRLISGIEVCASDGQACESGQVTLDPDTILPTTFTYDDLPDSPIPVGSATSCLGGNLITRTFIVSDSFIVADVDLGFNTELIYRNTIVPTLQSPDGTQVILHYPLGYPTQNLDVMWDDAAMAVIFDEEADHDTASPYYEHARQPDERLNAFNGEQAQGTWSLVICDHFSLTDENGFYNRSRLVLSTNALPSDTRAGWRYDVPITSDYEGLTQSLHIYGLDSVGNRTTDPLSLTFRVDTAAPAITVTTWPSVPLVLSAPLHVDGIVSDGNGIQVMRLLGYAPNRQTLAGTAHVEAPSNVVMTGSLVLPPLMSDWTYTDTSPFVISGNYELWVEAVDLAGNQSTAGPFQVTMTKPPEPQLVYLPLVTRNYELSESVVEPDAPDLALGWDTVIASTDAVTPTTITIYNVGSLSVTTGFRVDLYFDPTTVPTTGQSWDSLSTYGGYWLVTDTVLAIEPYQTISLTLTDTFYQAAGSNYPDPAVFAGLTTAYIQLDTFDQVTETHELGDRYDNNIVRYIIQDWTDLR
ncbi:MAG: hypothetical protein GY832_25900, partial [Chloroflexi bacterium]|nr:hypothetical protein [Chloroflexota bacterium]